MTHLERINVSDWSVCLGGLTVGDAGSLMSFWDGDFLSTANSPGRSANAIVCEYELDDSNKIAAGLLSNLPTTSRANTGLKNFKFLDPVYTLRWRYETDASTVHMSGLTRCADFSASPLRRQFEDTSAVRAGWAVRAGFNLPANFIVDDEFTVQASYAVDASAYPDLTTDPTIYQHTLRSVSATVGWSAVGSRKRRRCAAGPTCSGSRWTR